MMVLSIYKGLIYAPDPRPSMKDVIAFIAAREGLAAADILAPGPGSTRIKRARQEAMFHCREQEIGGKPRWSLLQMASAFRRDHTSVLNGIRRHRERLQSQGRALAA